LAPDCPRFRAVVVGIASRLLIFFLSSFAGLVLARPTHPAAVQSTAKRFWPVFPLPADYDKRHGNPARKTRYRNTSEFPVLHRASLIGGLMAFLKIV
jgi:hypothetical protein